MQIPHGAATVSGELAFFDCWCVSGVIPANWMHGHHWGPRGSGKVQTPASIRKSGDLTSGPSPRTGAKHAEEVPWSVPLRSPFLYCF